MRDLSNEPLHHKLHPVPFLRYMKCMAYSQMILSYFVLIKIKINVNLQTHFKIELDDYVDASLHKHCNIFNIELQLKMTMVYALCCSKIILSCYFYYAICQQSAMRKCQHEEEVPRYKPSTYQPISQWLSHCTNGASHNIRTVSIQNRVWHSTFNLSGKS